MVLEGTLNPEAALIDATKVLDPVVVEAAGALALQGLTGNSGLKTRSLHAELVYSISGSKHVRPCDMPGIELQAAYVHLDDIHVRYMLIPWFHSCLCLQVFRLDKPWDSLG